MLREEDLVTALMAYRQGRDGFVIDPETREVKTFYEVFRDLIKNHYLIDWKDQPEEKQEPAEELAEEEQEPAEGPAEEEKKVTDPFERFEKSGKSSPFSKPEPKKRGGKPEKGQVEELILKAWGGGEHSISEIMRITGYSYKTVRRYIPISPKG